METNKKKVELLAPAGDLERLKIAVAYGADAVYIGGKNFGLRAKAKNFDIPDMEEGIKYAHEHGIKVYVTANIFAHNRDLEPMRQYLETLEKIGADAFIISDPGVFMLAKEAAPNTEIHISTQANNTNYQSSLFWYNMGAKRIVAARELSLDEIREIRSKIPADMEIEAFIHGAMCISYSGRCLLSNYLTQRDSNQGDCAQPCRWKYALTEEKREGEYFPVEQDNRGTYIMNSRDMCMIEHIPELYEAGVGSFKIEGRAKSAYYTAVTVNAYRCALDAFEKSGFAGDFRPEKWMVDELYKISHREYCTGFYFSSPLDDAQIYYEGGYVRRWDVAAVAGKCENGILYGEQRNRFFEGDELEVMPKGAQPYMITVRNLRNGEGEPVDSAPHPVMKFSFSCDRDVPAGAYLRKLRTDEDPKG